MKKTILVLLVLLNLSLTGVQAQLNSNLDFAYETLSQRGEFYFSFSCDEPPIIRELSTKLSIDKVQGTTVFAYANAYEFEQFLTYGFEFEPVNDYYFTPKALTMATTVAQMANWDRYPTHAVYLQMLQNFVTNYPDLCRLETIGYSVNGKEIVCLVISDNVNQDEDEPEFFWTGTMHGDELTGWIMIMRFADYLLQNYGTDAQATTLVNEMEIYINPLSNPDGTYYGSSTYTNVATSRRANANGIDLNRNFPTVDGSSYTLQPEINIMIDYATNNDFVMSANTHGGAELANYPWDAWTKGYPDYNPHPDDNWWYYVSWIYAGLAQSNSPSGYFDDESGVTEGGDWYVISGSRQDYMNWYHNCRETTLELSTTKRLGTEYLNAFWNYNRQAMLDYTEQCLYGFRGIVTDACTGTALGDVKVEIIGHDEDNSWVYSSAPVGNYHRPIYAGTYNVTFSKTGYVTKTLPVTVTNNHSTRLDVQLVPASVATPAFTASLTSVPVGSTVNFTDQTSGTVTSRNWTFEQGNPPTSTALNPAVVYNTAGIFDVTLQITSAGCTLSEVKENYINVYVPGAPTPDFSADVTATCTGIVQFTNASVDATSYLWDFGDGSTSAEENPTHVYTANGVYTVSLSASNAYGTNIMTQSDYITVDMPLAPETTGDDNCGPGELTLSASGVGVLEWYDAAVDGNLVFTGENYTQNFSETAVFFVQSVIEPSAQYGGKTDNSGTGGYFGNPDAIHGLYFDAYTDFNLQSVKVYATGTKDRVINLKNSDNDIIATRTLNIPNGESRITLDFDIVAGTGYLIEGDGDIDLYRNGGNTAPVLPYPYVLSDVFSITGNTANNNRYYYFFYDWEVVVGDYCISARTPVSAVINEIPAALSVEGGGSFCGGSATLTASGAGDHNIFWQGTNPDGTDVTNEADEVEVSTSGTYYFRALTGSGCWGPSTGVSVTINPLPEAVVVTGGGTQCEGAAVLNATGGTGGTIYWQGTTSGGTSTSTPSASQTVTASGTYYFRARSAEGCWGPEGSATVTLVPAPEAVTVSGGGTQCGGNVTLTAGGGAGGTIYWQGTTSGGTSTSTASTSQTVSASGTYYFRSRSAEGCWGPQGSATVTINAVPALVTVSGGGTQCGGTRTLTASGGNGGTIYWQGTQSGGTSISTPSITQSVSASGTYYFRSRSSAGCWGPEGSAIVVINTLPEPVTVSGGGSTCNGSETLLASGGTGGTIYFQGTTSGGTSTSNPTNTYTATASGTYYFRAYSTEGCWGPEGSATVTLFPALYVSMSMTPESYAGALDGSATAVVSGGLAPYTYSWSNSNETNPIVGLEAGYYCVTVFDSNGCSAVNCITVTQGDQPNPPTAQFIANVHNGCGSLTVQFTDLSTNNPNEWLWSFGDGSQSDEQHPVHTYSEPGHYTVTLVVSNDDGDDDIVKNQFIHVWPLVEIELTSTVESAEGTADGTAGVSVLQGIPPFTFLWDNGGETATIEGLTAGMYCVTVTDSVGCMANQCVEVYLQTTNPLNAMFSYEQNGVCGTSTVNFYDESTGNITSWIWDFGDETQSIEQNPVHYYAQPGIYTVVLTVSDGITEASFQQTVTVFEIPQLSFEVTPVSQQGAADGEVVLTITGGTAPYIVNWSNGAHTTVISNLEAGFYSVGVIDANGCMATSSVTVQVATIIAGEKAAHIVLYPNPAGEMLYIDSEVHVKYVRIFDISGRCLMQKELMQGLNEVVTGNLATGSYLLEIQTGDEIILKRFNKE